MLSKGLSLPFKVADASSDVLRGYLFEPILMRPTAVASVDRRCLDASPIADQGDDQKRYWSRGGVLLA